MGVNCIVVVTVVFLSYVLLSDQLVPEALGVKTNDSPASPDIKPVLVCVNQLENGTYGPAADCKNGRRMSGCCVERNYCNFNTSHIDLTMYGPRGYRDPCAGNLVCCPMKYVMPIVPSHESASNDADDSLKDFDED